MARRNVNRCTLEFSDKTFQEIDALVSETNASSKSEVLRAAIRTYYNLVQRTNSGASVIIRERDGTEKELLLLT